MWASNEIVSQMNRRSRSWLKWVALAVFIAAAAYLFLPQLLAAMQVGLGAVLYVLLGIFGVCVLPFVLTWLLGFAYWFTRPYIRVWHIRHIRSNRLLMEAANRDRQYRSGSRDDADSEE